MYKLEMDFDGWEVKALERFRKITEKLMIAENTKNRIFENFQAIKSLLFYSHIDVLKLYRKTLFPI